LIYIAKESMEDTFDRAIKFSIYALRIAVRVKIGMALFTAGGICLEDHREADKADERERTDRRD
jgi:hypothetical protein